MFVDIAFGVALVLLVVILAHSTFGRLGQRNINKHPVDSRSDVPPGAGRPPSIAGTNEADQPNNPNAQHGVR